jgi:hypothetical protein
MIRQRMRRDANGDLHLTVRITGHHDIYRFAHNWTHDQVEFCREGVSILAKLRRRLGKQSYAGLLDYMHGTGNGKTGRRPTVADLTRSQAASVLARRARDVPDIEGMTREACRMGADALREPEVHWWRCPTNPRHEYGLRQPAPPDALCPDCCALNAELDAQKAGERIDELEQELAGVRDAAHTRLDALEIDREGLAARVAELEGAVRAWRGVRGVGSFGQVQAAEQRLDQLVPVDGTDSGQDAATGGEQP